MRGWILPCPDRHVPDYSKSVVSFICMCDIKISCASACGGVNCGAGFGPDITCSSHSVSDIAGQCNNIPTFTTILYEYDGFTIQLLMTLGTCQATRLLVLTEPIFQLYLTCWHCTWLHLLRKYHWWYTRNLNGNLIAVLSAGMFTMQGALTTLYV